MKSTDDSMIETLEKMSGKTHRVRKNQKSVTRDLQKQWQQGDSKVTYTMSTNEEPVISFNDMAFIAERNSIVFRAGDSPIWNRNQMALPMSWRLFQNTIVDPGQEYTLQSIPTLSTALDFDVRKNQPDFIAMLEWRIYQACAVDEAKEIYAKRYGYDEHDIVQLDPDTYSADVMRIVNKLAKQYKDLDDEIILARKTWEQEQEAKEADVQKQNEAQAGVENIQGQLELVGADDDYPDDEPPTPTVSSGDSLNMTTNHDVTDAIDQNTKLDEEWKKKIFAHGHLSRSDFATPTGIINRSMDGAIQDVLRSHPEIWNQIANNPEFKMASNGHAIVGGSADDSGIVYIRKIDRDAEQDTVNEDLKDPNARVYSEDGSEQPVTYEITDAFFRYLANSDSWKQLGRFDAAMAEHYEAVEAQTSMDS